MADLDATLKTLTTSGKFIRPPDRLALEARARALRAEALRELARTFAASVRGWIARRVAERHRADHTRPRTA